MKFFTVILLVLAFGPSLLDCVLRGHNVPAPTSVFATKTFTDAVIACKATVQVPPTAVLVRDHNKVGISDALPIPSFYGKIFSIDSTISILTESQVTSQLSFTSIGNVALAFKLARRVQTLWNSIFHWRKHGLGRLIDGIVVFYVYLWTFFAVGLALLQKRAVQRPHLTPEPVVQFESPLAPVAWIEIASVEGLLLLFSYTTKSPESLDQWKGLWIPRRKYTYYLSNGPANREVVHNAADPTLLGILLQTVPTYHPWAPQLARTLLASRGRCFTSELTVQFGSTFGREQCSVRKLHFRRSIFRTGGPPTQIVRQVVTPRRERVLIDWIQIPSHEGTLILYGYSAISTHRPTEWTSQWFPRQTHTYYLSDRPANRDSLLLDVLPHSISIYHPWAPQLAGALLDFPGEVFEETGFAAATDSAIEVEVATSTLLPPSLQSVSACIEDYSFPVPSQPASSVPEVPTWSTSVPGPSFSSSGVLPSFSYNTAGYQHTPAVYPEYPALATYHHEPMVCYPYGTSGTYQQTPVGYYPSTTPAAHQQRPTVYHQYPAHQTMWQPLTVEQAAPAREAIRPSVPLLVERASQRNASGFWAPGSTGFEEEAMEENEPEEAPKKKLRRGGKRKTARKLKWEELERQRRGEGDPEAGPSRPT